MNFSPMKLQWLIFVAGACLVSSSFAAQDVEKSKDYPALKRWPHSHIEGYTDKDFDAFEFESPDQATRVEGRTIHISYAYDEGTDEPSELKFLRNYQTALAKAGWTIVTKPEDHLVVAKLVKDQKEVWMQVKPTNGGYYVDIVEKGEMKQEVSASDMLEELNSSGHVALQINFDSGKAIIKEDSKPVIEQMIQLLKDAPDLVVEIQGHTDNTGDANADQVLSEQRATAVKNALTSAGIAENRLTAKGYGLTKPVADNATPEGRAKNRRVELVKKASAS
jgi:OOP family OmpA-OmpF porin